MDEDTGMIRIEIIVKDDADVNEASNTQGTIDDPLHYYSVEFLMISSSWSSYYSGSYCLALLVALELQTEKFSCQFFNNCFVCVTNCMLVVYFLPSFLKSLWCD